MMKWTRMSETRERNEGRTSRVAEERRKVNIVRDGIRRNYCRIKIYRISEVRLGKFTSSCAYTHRLWVSNILRVQIATRAWTNSWRTNRKRARDFSKLEMQARSSGKRHVRLTTVKFYEIPSKMREINPACFKYVPCMHLIFTEKKKLEWFFIYT